MHTPTTGPTPDPNRSRPTPIPGKPPTPTPEDRPPDFGPDARDNLVGFFRLLLEWAAERAVGAPTAPENGETDAP